MQCGGIKHHLYLLSIAMMKIQIFWYFVLCQLVVANISEGGNASISRLKKSKKSVRMICYLQHYFSHVQFLLKMCDRIIQEPPF